MWRLWEINPGFDPHNVLTYAVAGAPNTDGSANGLRMSYAALLDRMRQQPGVQAVSFCGGSIPMNGDAEVPFWVIGQAHSDKQSELPWALFYLVDADYQKVMRIP